MNPTSPSQVTLTPHRIDLVVVSPSTNSTRSSTENKWWRFSKSKEEVNLQSSNSSEGERIKLVAKKVFFPPIDKVSIRVCWWG